MRGGDGVRRAVNSTGTRRGGWVRYLNPSRAPTMVLQPVNIGERLQIPSQAITLRLRLRPRRCPRTSGKGRCPRKKHRRNHYQVRVRTRNSFRLGSFRSRGKRNNFRRRGNRNRGTYGRTCCTSRHFRDCARVSLPCQTPAELAGFVARALAGVATRRRRSQRLKPN